MTAPHKAVAAEVADERSQRVGRLGVANTLWVCRPGRVAAANTDVAGVEASLRALGVGEAGSGVVLVLGAGGAAAAVVEACASTGRAVLVVCRDVAAGVRRFSEDVGWGQVRVAGWSAAWSDWAPPEEVAVVVDATSLRHAGSDVAVRAYGALGLERLGGSTAWFDLGYGSTRSRFLEVGESRGGATLDGLCMLLHQGAVSYGLWFGEYPPLETMARALCDATQRPLSEVPLEGGVVERATAEERVVVPVPDGRG